MPEAITNTSPLVYLHRVQSLEWLPQLFEEVWVPAAVIEPASQPSEWLSSDLGAGELAAIALALENPSRILIVDDGLARRTAQAAGLEVWGTLRIILEAKSQGLTERAAPLVDRLAESGLWFSQEIRRRILKLAKED